MALSALACAVLLAWTGTDALVHHSQFVEESDQLEFDFMHVLPKPVGLEGMNLTLLAPDEGPYNLRYPTATSYSQWRQDTTLEPIFRNIAKGFFVESGALTGEIHSNTLLLERRGWSGLLVEPNPTYARAVRNRHRKAYFFEGALSPTRDREICRFGGFKIEEDPNRPSMVDVVAEPLQSLLKVIGQKTVDFWSLDIEGFEGRVLNSTDFVKVEIGTLLVEMAWAKDTLVEEVMEREGFKLIGKTYYQKQAIEIKDASPERPWIVLDAVYVNPAYFKRRALPVPTQIGESSHLYDCAAASMRKERDAPPLEGDDRLLRTC